MFLSHGSFEAKMLLRLKLYFNLYTSIKKQFEQVLWKIVYENSG